MAFGGSASFSSKKFSTPTTLAEINVTPLVDVMLVLLIVFMISAPLMQQGMQVDLPKANTGSLNQVPDQVVLVVKGSRDITLNGSAVAHGMLYERLKAISDVKPEVQVFVQADQNLSYGFIAQVVAEVKRAKIQRVGLVTEPGESKPL